MRGPGVWQAVPVMILVGLGNAAPTALIVAVLSELMPQARGGEFIGIAAGVWSLVQPFGGFIAGWLVDTYGGDIRWAFGCAAIMMAITLTALFMVKTSCLEQERNGPTTTRPFQLMYSHSVPCDLSGRLPGTRDRQFR